MPNNLHSYLIAKNLGVDSDTIESASNENNQATANNSHSQNLNHSELVAQSQFGRD